MPNHRHAHSLDTQPGVQHDIFIYDCSDLNTAVHEQKNRLYPGWTNVIFNGNGIEIKGDEELFFGYDYVETPEIATGEIGPIGVTGTQTPGGFNLLRNGELIELTGAGVVCVQLIIDITNLPQTNLAFTFTDTGFKYKQLGEQISFFASVANVGRDDVENFTAEIALDGNIIDTQQVDMALKAGASETWQTNIKLPETTGIGTHHLTIAITGINGVETDRRPTATCSTRLRLLQRVNNPQAGIYRSLLKPAIRLFTISRQRAGRLQNQSRHVKSGNRKDIRTRHPSGRNRRREPLESICLRCARILS